VSGWWLASYLVLWCLVAALTVVVIALIRQIGLLHLRLAPTGALDIGEGPALGEHAPRMPVVAPGQEALVLFGSESCALCRALLPAAAALARAEPGLAVVVTSASASFAADVPPPAVGLADVATVAAYRVRATPFAVYLDPNGVVGAKGIVNTLEQLEQVVARGREQAVAAPV
jgi:methylamine dehydrogenase accessory protein MauD